jgi:cytoskeletal protein RodZ
MQKDPLLKLGAKIKEAREKRRWSIEELSNQSRVSIRNIKNIEQGKREELPEEAYLHGFLSLLFKALDVEKAAKALEEYKEEESKYVVQSILDQDPYSFDRQKKANYKSKTSYFRIYHLYIFVIVLVLTSIVILLNKNHLDKPIVKLNTLSQDLEFGELTESDPEVTGTQGELLEVSLSEEPAKEILDTINEKETSKKSFIAGKGDKYIKIRVLDRAWFQAIAISTNQILFEGDVFVNLEPNYFFLRDDDGFVIATGNAGALEVDTGEGYNKLGEKDQLTKSYFPKSARSLYLKKIEKKKVENLDNPPKTPKETQVENQNSENSLNPENPQTQQPINLDPLASKERPSTETKLEILEVSQL